jgi:RTX calcium-binding nonapeptide repeat (4 copies)
LTIVLLLLLLKITTLQKEGNAQQVIDNEIFSKNNNGDNSDINKVVAKPLVHVSITGTEISDKIRGGKGNYINGGDGDDDLQGNEGDDKIDGGDGDDIMDGWDGEDDLKGGKGADRFMCDKADKIVDYNSLENDKILGHCKYEDKGLIPPAPIQDKSIPKMTSKKSLFPNSEIHLATIMNLKNYL